MDSDAGPVLSSRPSWNFQSLLDHLDICSLLHPFLQSHVSSLLLKLLAQFCKPHNDGLNVFIPNLLLKMPGKVLHTYNPNTWEVEAGGLLQVQA